MKTHYQLEESSLAMIAYDAGHEVMRAVAGIDEDKWYLFETRSFSNYDLLVIAYSRENAMVWLKWFFPGIEIKKPF